MARKIVGKYETHVKPRLNEIFEARSNGMGKYELSKKLEIDYKTLCRWAETHEELQEALRGEEVALDQVEGSLHKTATGYYIEETQSNGVIKKTYIKPSLGAIIFLLTNRRPDRWKNQLKDNSELITTDDALDKITKALVKKVKEKEEDN